MHALITYSKGAPFYNAFTAVIRNSAQFDAGAQIAATVHPTSSADQLLPSALKRTSSVYCFVRAPCTAVPGAVFMALISFPRPMMTMLQVPSE